jgi:hypothetical protein
MYIKYLMGLMFICSVRVLICCLEMLYFLLISVMNILCVLPQALAVSMRIGSTFQPRALMSFMRFSYFIVFSCFFVGEYLSLQ